jgi:type III secretory pathway component EscV
MSRISLSELSFESHMEDQFWKTKTWNGFENESNVEVLKEGIKLLLEIVTQKQSVIKSLISYQIKQDLQDRLENNFDDLVAELDKVAVD